MPFDVTMPKLTDSMEEGRIVEWKVAPGDRVREGDVLAEIETDKAVMELESFWDGTVAELLRGNGDVAAVGDVIARIAQAGEEAAAGGSPGEPGPAPEREAPARPPEPEGPPQVRTRGAPGGQAPIAAEDRRPPRAAAPPQVPLPGARPLAERGGKESPRPAPPPPRPAQAATTPLPAGPAPGVRASPRARKLAREKGIDLAKVRGTGPQGRVTAADVEAAASQASAPAPSAAGAELPPVTFAEGEAEVQEVSFYQKAAIRRVTASARAVPHFYVSATVDAQGLARRRAAAGEGVTLTHLLLRAAALALERFPDANRSYDGGRWLRWKVVNLGVAVQTDAGLAVAVLRGAQGKDLAWIAEQTRALVGRAREGKLRPEERTNATFTLSNLGAFGVERFTAIINPPSALTLAAGAVGEAPVVRDGRVEVGRVLHLTLSCDHRVVDGVLAAQFLGDLRYRLEHPEEL